MNFKNYLQSKGYSNQSIALHYRNLNAFINWTQAQNIETELANYNELLSYVKSLQKKGVKQRTVQLHITSLNHYFKWLNQLEMRPDNPVSNIQIKGIKRKTLYHILNKQELESLYQAFEAPEQENKNTCTQQNQNWHQISKLVSGRNKVIVGLLIWQGLGTKELGKLTVNDVNLRQGTIYIAGTRRSNQRTLQLQAHQVLDMMEYTLQTRIKLLDLTDKITEQFFVSAGTSDKLSNSIQKLLSKLKAKNKKVTSIQQIRTSVITHWLKNNNLREVQYRAGHRYVSSTESYLINDLDDLTEDINKFHPIV